MLNNPAAYEQMAAVEGQHWWYRCLHEKVLDAICSITTDQSISILDAACGTGGLMHFLQQQGYPNCQGFDRSDHALKIAHARQLPVRQGDLQTFGDLFPSYSQDLIICNDALYFLTTEERPRFFEQALQVLRPGGHLLLNLPAGKAFKGDNDMWFAIPERFSKKMLRQSIQGLPLEFETAHYWPFLLSPFVLMVRGWQRLFHQAGSSQSSGSDIALPSGWINQSCYALTKFEGKFGLNTLWGSSLFVVIRKIE